MILEKIPQIDQLSHEEQLELIRELCLGSRLSAPEKSALANDLIEDSWDALDVTPAAEAAYHVMMERLEEYRRDPSTAVSHETVMIRLNALHEKLKSDAGH